MNNHYRTIVIGGGLSGLVAALNLAERGLAPLVIESEPRFGGRFSAKETVTLTAQGRDWQFPAEHGIHGIWGQYNNLRAVMGRYAIATDLVPAKQEEWLHGEGRVMHAEAGSMVRLSPIPAPFHYIGLLARPRFLAMLTLQDLIGLPRTVGSIYLALAYDPLMEPAPLEGRTLKELFHRWPPRLRAFISSLLRSGLAAHPEDVPLNGFLAFMRFYTLLRRDAWVFDYFPADSGSFLIDPLVAKLQALGGTTQCNTSATRVERTATGWRIFWKETEGAGEGSVEADQVVVALDAPAAQKIFTTSPATAKEAVTLQWPRGLATGVVRLWFDTVPNTAVESGICSGDLIIDNFFWLHRFQRAVTEWHAATGGSVVESHIYGPQLLLDQPDAALLAQAISDIYRAYPELRGHLLHSTLQRNIASHTRFEVGASPSYLGVESPWAGISCCGDWVRYSHPALFLERACVTGIAAANRVLHATGLPTYEVLPVRPPEAPAAAIQWMLRGVRRIVARLGAKKKR